MERPRNYEDSVLHYVVSTDKNFAHFSNSPKQKCGAFCSLTHQAWVKNMLQVSGSAISLG